MSGQQAPVRRRKRKKSNSYGRGRKNSRNGRSGKNSSFRIFLAAYAGLWLVLTIALCIVLWNNLAKYQKSYEAAEASGNPELAMQEYMDMFLPENIGELIDRQQPQILSRFETIEDYKSFYKAFLTGKTISYVKDEEHYNDARPVYDVYAADTAASDIDSGVLIGIVSLKAAGEKDDFGFNKWEVKDVVISENNYDYHDVYVKVMDDMQVYINGIEAGEQEYITGGLIDNAITDKAYELTGVTFNYKVYYAGDMVTEPVLKVVDAEGNDVTDSYVMEENDLKSYVFTASEEFVSGVEDRVREFCETYVYHIYRKASVSAVAAMMEDGSQAENLLYNAQSTLAWAWVPDTVEILDESYDEFMYYNDSYFSCRSTIDIRKSDEKTTEDEKFVCQWMFKRVNGEWLVTYFILG